MPTTTLTATQFGRSVRKALEAAKHGPVYITDRGRPAHVLLIYEEYRAVARHRISLAEALRAPDDIDFDPPRLGREPPNPAQFDD